MPLVRLSPDGPDNAGPARGRRVDVRFRDDALNLTVGVRTAADMQAPPDPCEGDEFFVVLEGGAELRNEKGDVTRIATGEACVTRDGAPLSLRPTGFLRQTFIRLTGGAKRPVVSGQNAFPARPAPDAHPLKDADVMFGGGRQREATLFRNDAGNMEAGIWASTPFRAEAGPFGVHEFAHIIEGDVTITDGDGARHEFTAGESLFLTADTVCRWESAGGVRKYYAAITPE